jgi:adenosine deaminase
MRDPELLKRLAKEQIPLTVCPLSNTKLCVVDDMKNYPLPEMLNAGLKVTLNSDAPAYFGGYLNENYEAVSNILNDDKDTFAQLARNSLSSAFIAEAKKLRLIDEVDHYLLSVKT